jgi:hypothetical protein
LKPDWDRGYEKGREAGIVEEQTRIIKLLDGLIDKRTTYEMPMEYWVQKKLLEYVIALIKGEK